MESKYIVHIAEDGRKQSVSEHCRNTVEYASDSLKNIGAEKAAYLASWAGGLKYKPRSV